MQAVYDEFTDEIKLKIADEANKYFVQLLDKESRETLRSILVKDDYSLQILDRWGEPFLANISAGQRQIMSISFIARWQILRHLERFLRCRCLWIHPLVDFPLNTEKIL